MEKNDRERAALAKFYIDKAVFELECIELIVGETEEVKNELFDITSSLADLSVSIGALADKIRLG